MAHKKGELKSEKKKKPFRSGALTQEHNEFRSQGERPTEQGEKRDGWPQAKEIVKRGEGSTFIVPART